MPSTDHVTEAERHEIWNQWLDGDTVSRIHSYQAGELSKSAIKAVLDDEPPTAIRNDARWIHGGRFFWISVSHGYPKAADGQDMAFVIAKMPYRMTQRAFARGVRAIRRDFKELHPQADLTLGVIEGIEAEVAMKLVANRGFHGWSMDEEGSIAPLTFVEPDETPRGPGIGR